MDVIWGPELVYRVMGSQNQVMIPEEDEYRVSGYAKSKVEYAIDGLIRYLDDTWGVKVWRGHIVIQRNRDLPMNSDIVRLRWAPKVNSITLMDGPAGLRGQVFAVQDVEQPFAAFAPPALREISGDWARLDTALSSPADTALVYRKWGWNETRGHWAFRQESPKKRREPGISVQHHTTKAVSERAAQHYQRKSGYQQMIDPLYRDPEVIEALRNLIPPVMPLDRSQVRRTEDLGP